MSNIVPIIHACDWVQDWKNIQYCEFFEGHPLPYPAPLMPHDDQAWFPKADIEELHKAILLFKGTGLCGYWIIPPCTSDMARTADGFTLVFTFMSFKVLVRQWPLIAAQAAVPIRYVKSKYLAHTIYTDLFGFSRFGTIDLATILTAYIGALEELGPAYNGYLQARTSRAWYKCIAEDYLICDMEMLLDWKVVPTSWNN